MRRGRQRSGILTLFLSLRPSKLQRPTALKRGFFDAMRSCRLRVCRRNLVISVGSRGRTVQIVELINPTRGLAAASGLRQCHYRHQAGLNPRMPLGLQKCNLKPETRHRKASPGQSEYEGLYPNLKTSSPTSVYHAGALRPALFMHVVRVY